MGAFSKLENRIIYFVSVGKENIYAFIYDKIKRRRNRFIKNNVADTVQGLVNIDSVVFNFVNIFLLLYPPFKKGAYCFAPVGRPVGLPSVDRSVCEPNDIHSMSVKVDKLGTVGAPME